MEKLYAVEAQLKEMYNDDIITLWCNMCDFDDYIHSMDDFNDIFNGRDPLDIIAMANGSFSTNDEYFAFDSVGNIVSFDYIDDYYSFSYDTLAEYLIRNGENDGIFDKDTLIEAFANEYGGEYPIGFNIVEALNELQEEWSFDILTDDWDEINDELHKFKGIEIE